MRALSGLNSKLQLFSQSDLQLKQSNADLNVNNADAFANVSSVLKLGFDQDEQSKVDMQQIQSPLHDVSLNASKSKFAFQIENPASVRVRDAQGYIMATDVSTAVGQSFPPSQSYRAAMEVSTMLPEIKNNTAIRRNEGLSIPIARRESHNRQYTQMLSNDQEAIRRLRINHIDSPSKVVTSRTGNFHIDMDYIDRRQQEIEEKIYIQSALSTKNILDRNKYGTPNDENEQAYV